MGAVSFPASATASTFATVFDNSVTSFSCQTPGIYNPIATDKRKIVMQFNDGAGWQTLPAMTINAVPYAMYATKSRDSIRLNNKADTAFVEYATLASLNCNAATHAITFNGVSFSCIAVGSGSGIGVTSVTTSGSVLTTAGTASAPVLGIQAVSVSQDGYLTALDYSEFKAKLAASSTQIINVLGEQATASSTVNTIVKRDSSGNISLNGISAVTANLNYVDIYKPSSSINIRLQAPTSLSSNYVLNLPATSGTIGQVLSTDGSGNLSWINPSTGSVVSVSAAAPLASTAGSNPTISLAQANSTADGYLSSADWYTFNNKLNATSGAMITALGYEPVASGSVVSSQWVSSGSAISYNDGNVGIDAGNPTHKLEVNGNIGVDGKINHRLNSNLFLGFVNGLNQVQLGANGSAQMTLTASGNLGLGTSAPSVPLQIVTNTNANAGFRLETNSGAGSELFPQVVAKDSSNADLIFTYGVKGGAGGFGTEGHTFVGSQTNHPFGIRTNNQTRIGISSSGNVGIGTTAPTAHLQIAAGTLSNAPLKFTSGTLLSSPQSGTIEYDGSQFYVTDGTNTRKSIATTQTQGSFDNTNAISNSSGNITLSPNSSTGSVVVSATTASINSNTGALVVKGGVGVSGDINTSGTLTATGGVSTSVIQGNMNLLLNPSGGNVGIGTENPNNKLTIGVNLGSGFALTANSEASPYGAIVQTTEAIPTPNPAFWVRTSPDSGATANSLLRIQNDGNVGINTSSAAYNLQVNAVSGSGSLATLSLQSDRNSDSNHGGLYFNSKSNSLKASILGAGPNTSTGGLLRFTVQDSSGSDVTRMTITASGHVGIGTTSPVAALDIGSTNGQLWLRQGSGGALPSSAGAGLKIETNSVGGIIQAYNYTSGTALPLQLNPSGGNVGVGLADPERPLHIRSSTNGVVRVDRASSMPAVEFNRYSASDFSTIWSTWQIGTDATSATSRKFIIADVSPVLGAGINRMVIDQDGKVGIGTTSPTSKLSVAGSVDLNGWFHQASISNTSHPNFTTDGAYILLAKENTSDKLFGKIYGYRGGPVSSPRGFEIEVALDLSSGFSPTVAIKGGYRTQTLKLAKVSYNSDTWWALRIDPGTFNHANIVSFSGFRSVTDLDNFMRRVDQADPLITAISEIDYAYLNPGIYAQNDSGNLGIGITSPESKLHIVGGATNSITYQGSGATKMRIGQTQTADDYQIRVNGTMGSTMVLDDPTKSTWALRVGSFADDFSIFRAAPGATTFPGTPILKVTSGGAIGIGATIPSEKLHVVGNLRVQGSTDCTLGNGAGGTNCSSDARLKENIKPIPYALEKINSLKGVEFDWNQKSLSFGRHDIGVIAQDVEKVFPTAVITDLNSGYKRVDYAVLVAPIIQAIKELYGFVENKADKAVIESLKKQNEEKQKEINALKNYLCKKDKEAPFCN